MSVHTYASAIEASVSQLRTHSGDHEIDLIVERGHRVVAIEVKLARDINNHDVKNLLWLKKLLGDRLADAVIVNTGPFAYRRQDGIGVIPATLLTA